MILILDHRDSFTYNIHAALCSLDIHSVVISTADTTQSLQSFEPRVSGLILSPGPGHPRDVTAFYKALDVFVGRVPILGVCLGHQAIACHFGGEVIGAREIIHGKAIPIAHDGQDIFKDMPKNFMAMRYNSLTVGASLPESLVRTAWSGEDVMGIRHATEDVRGVQFHPESVGTPEGIRLLANFVKHVRASAQK